MSKHIAIIGSGKKPLSEIMEQKCRNCFNYQCEWCEKVNDSPDPDRPRDCEHFRRLTNGDHFRRKTDAELGITFANLVGYVNAPRAVVERYNEDNCSWEQAWEYYFSLPRKEKRK